MKTSHLVFITLIIGVTFFGYVPLLKATNVTTEGIKFPDGSLQTTASMPSTTPGGANIFSKYIHLNLTKNTKVETAILTVPQGQTFVFTGLVYSGYETIKFEFKQNQTIVFANIHISYGSLFSLSSGIPFQSGTTFNLSTEYAPPPPDEMYIPPDTVNVYIFISGYYVTSN